MPITLETLLVKICSMVYNSHFHRHFESKYLFIVGKILLYQIPILTVEILKNRFLMQIQSHMLTFSDLHLSVFTSIPIKSTWRSSAMPFYWIFCISMMYCRCIYAPCFFSFVFPFCLSPLFWYSFEISPVPSRAFFQRLYQTHHLLLFVSVPWYDSYGNFFLAFIQDDVP